MGKQKMILLGVISLLLLFVGVGVVAGSGGVEEDHSIPTASPTKTVPGDEIQVGDASAPDSPVQVMKSEIASISKEVDLGEVTVRAGYSTGTIKVITDKPDHNKVQYLQGTVGPLGAIPISGTLAPGYAHFYGPYFYSVGDIVTISIIWVPPGSVFRIGLTSQQTGIFYGCEVYNGAGSCSLVVNKAGWYYPTVWNIGPYTATYSGFVYW